MNTTETKYKITQDMAVDALCWLTGSDRPVAALKLMLDADKFCIMENTVRFRFKGSRSINYFILEYDAGMDLWNAVFKYFRNGKLSFIYKEVKRCDGLYCDKLKEVFEETTGLCLTVPRVIGINA